MGSDLFPTPGHLTSCQDNADKEELERVKSIVAQEIRGRWSVGNPVNIGTSKLTNNKRVLVKLGEFLRSKGWSFNIKGDDRDGSFYAIDALPPMGSQRD
jgi:hypothetical protein